MTSLKRSRERYWPKVPASKGAALYSDGQRAQMLEKRSEAGVER